MKKLIFLLITLAGCTSHMTEYTVVRSVQQNDVGKVKYKVELDFFMFNQIVFTDSVYNPGDTLFLIKK